MQAHCTVRRQRDTAARARRRGDELNNAAAVALDSAAAATPAPIASPTACCPETPDASAPLDPPAARPVRRRRRDGTDQAGARRRGLSARRSDRPARTWSGCRRPTSWCTTHAAAWPRSRHRTTSSTTSARATARSRSPRPRQFGANAVGIEYNPDMAKLAQLHRPGRQASAARSRSSRATSSRRTSARPTVVTMYLLPELNLCVRTDILEHEAGHARHVAPVHDGRLGGRRDRSRSSTAPPTCGSCRRDVAGNWALARAVRRHRSASSASTQNFQKVSGDGHAGRHASSRCVGAVAARRPSSRFAFNDDKGETRTFTGTVNGNELTGS
ncbi:MAG: hypothetical protein MZW92_40165 [Comamonadaceae bacterium]|nr:hypothetical protein [Comamonadaceae bacterium]